MSNIINSLALEDVTRSIIMVAGVGGAGGNALNHMVDLGINDVTFMACNTDAQALEMSKASIKVQLGSGLGAGNMPEMGSQAAKESLDDIINVFRTEGTKMLFITAGMGGGTGTGASPVIARAAQELDILTVGIVTTPYTDEGPLRTAQAAEGIEELRQYTDSLLVLSNDSISELYGDLTVFEGFWKADDVLATAVKGIAEIITGHGTVNVDFADVNTVMRGSGRAFMGSARAEGGDRALNAVESSVNSLLLNHRDITGAKNILLNISYGDKPVTQREASTIRNYLQERTGWTANLIWGTAYKAGLGDSLELTIVATGFDGETGEEVLSVPKPVVSAPVAEVAEVAEPATANDGLVDVPASDYIGGRRYMPQTDASSEPVTVAAQPVAAAKSEPRLSAGTVEAKGGDKYDDIDELISTPAWVRAGVSLSKDGVKGKASLKSSETEDAPKPNSLFE